MEGVAGHGPGPMGDMEASFKAFLQQPENKAVVEAHQREEALEALKAQELQHSKQFRATVLDSGLESKRSIGRYLAIPALRRIISTFQNGESGTFQDWSTNPQVLDMLAAAKAMVDDGRISAEELDHNIQRQLQNTTRPDAGLTTAADSQTTVRLPMEQLVEALNEHLTERRKGNDRYRAGDLQGAETHYKRALAIVEYVRGMSPDEQAEVDVNRVAVLLNIAAVAMARKLFGDALEACGQALHVDPTCCKAYLRRARAHTGRHDYKEAQTDLGQALSLQPGCPEATKLLESLQSERQARRSSERSMAVSMIQK